MPGMRTIRNFSLAPLNDPGADASRLEHRSVTEDSCLAGVRQGTSHA